MTWQEIFAATVPELEERMSELQRQLETCADDRYCQQEKVEGELHLIRRVLNGDEPR